MRDAAVNARSKVERTSRQNFDRDENLRLAVAFLIIQIGEAAGRVSPAFQAAHPEIDWPQIVSMRHRLVHGYDTIDYDLVWSAASEDLPPLIATLHGLLGL
jgi:uncharacterized protein with HEPN domain